MYYDSHTHTDNSHDCLCPIENLCENAAKRGLKAISITDHADTPEWSLYNIPENIARSYKQAEKFSEKYSGRLEILKGIELGEPLFYPELSTQMLSQYNFDIVLGSMHILRNNQDFSSSDFSSCSRSFLKDYLDEYYKEVYKMAIHSDFDVLTHITYPFRYINGKYGRNMKIEAYYDIIREIFKIICERGIALEMNTSGMATDWQTFMPDKDLLLLYKDTGGRLITLGSDSHKRENAAIGFDKAVKLLSECGFCEYYYYKSRKPVAVKL